MLELFQKTIVSQYEATLCTLNECVARCPEEMWQGPVVNHPFSQTVFHTLFFADLYLGENMAAQPEQVFHQKHKSEFADYEQLEHRIPLGTYEKSFIKDYLGFCRDKAAAVVWSESAELLTLPSGFPWIEAPRAEVHLYNIRHIQHHAAQLILRLREKAAIDMPWVKSGWQTW